MTRKGAHNQVIAANIAAGLHMNERGELVYPSGKVCRSGNGTARYRRVSLTYAGRVIGVTKARVLCWLTYGPPPTQEHEADHVDGNPLNDSPANLRWATRSENGANITPERTEARRALMRRKHAEIKRKLASHDALVAQRDSLLVGVNESSKALAASIAQRDALVEVVGALCLEAHHFADTKVGEQFLRAAIERARAALKAATEE